MRGLMRLGLVLAALLALAGCSSMGAGGAPAASFDVDTDLEALNRHFSPATSVSNYYQEANSDAAAVTARNRFITGRMVQIDLNYIKFIKTLTADKQRIDAATDMTNLTLGLAGTLVGGVRAKANLAAAATGISGSKTTIDKEYYYEKSMDALIGTMNAKRKEVLVMILQGMAKKTIAEYPFELALTQLNEYYMAGTINGALSFINANSAAQEKASNDEIKKTFPRLTPTTPEIAASTKQLTLAINKATVPTAQKVLADMGEDGSGTDLDKLKDKLHDLVLSIPATNPIESRAALAEKMTKSFKQAGWL